MFLTELKWKPSQSSVNGLLNNSWSVKPDIMEVDSRGHALFPSSAYSVFSRIHVRRESMARGTMVHFNFARA